MCEQYMPLDEPRVPSVPADDQPIDPYHLKRAEAFGPKYDNGESPVSDPEAGTDIGPRPLGIQCLAQLPPVLTLSPGRATRIRLVTKDGTLDVLVGEIRVRFTDKIELEVIRYDEAVTGPVETTVR